jgi:hypothetical protein
MDTDVDEYNKAPGIAGIGSEFYTENWDIINSTFRIW